MSQSCNVCSSATGEVRAQTWVLEQIGKSSSTVPMAVIAGDGVALSVATAQLQLAFEDSKFTAAPLFVFVH